MQMVETRLVAKTLEFGKYTELPTCENVKGLRFLIEFGALLQQYDNFDAVLKW